MTRALPTGTVTFLFTDVEGSTRLLDELGAERYADALAEHRRVLREAFAAYGGVEVDTQGDAFFYAFADAQAAVEAGSAGQAALERGPIRVRMGLHTGAPVVTEEGYVGADVHKAARIAAAGHGGQIVVSEATRLAAAAELRPLGAHRLKDLTAPEPLWQLGNGDFPPLKSLNQSNLPVQPTPFLGRERELAEVMGVLEREDVRAVTLTGPGGSGKTRLAVQAAAEAVDDFPHGVWWVPLQAIRDSALVEPAIASTVGAQDGLAEHLEGKRLLLVLDNFEQVVDAAPRVGELLSASAEVKLLVTSREPLRVAAEHEYAVPPLVEQEAVEFFVSRARAVKPDFEPDEGVAALCRRLDSLPLALELAAARVKTLSPRRLLERLDRRLPMLTGGRRDAPERQRTLRATIAWSYDLLSPEEQVLFRRLAVFAGGWTLEAAEEIAGADLDALASLVDKSLVHADGERFGMLETIREYAVEMLHASGEIEAIGRRHGEFFVAVAESANLAAEAEGPQQHAVAIGEQANLRAALDFLAATDVAAAARLAVALENFWVTNNPEEGARRIGDLMEELDVMPPALRPRVLRAYASVASSLALGEAVSALERSLAEYRSLGDERGVAIILHRLAVIALQRGERAHARRLSEESLEVHRRVRFLKGEVQALGTLGHLEWADGRRERALELLAESADAAGEIGFYWWQAGALAQYADYALRLGRPADADARARTTLRIFRHIGDRPSMVWALALIASAAAEAGDAEEAGRLWGAFETAEKEAPPTWDVDERERYTARAAQYEGLREFEEARSEGRRLALDEAVEYVLRTEAFLAGD